MTQSNTNTIILKIEELVQEGGLNYIEAIIEYCNKNSIEIEFGASIVKKDPLLKAKVELEARQLLLLNNSENEKKNSNKLRKFISDDGIQS